MVEAMQCCNHCSYELCEDEGYLMGDENTVRGLCL